MVTNGLQMTKGARVPYPERLAQGYCKVEDGRFIANVDAGKMLDVMTTFLVMHGEEELCFFFLELPVDELEERRLNSEALKQPEITTSVNGVPMTGKVLFKTHVDVYYMDAMKLIEAVAVLHENQEVLINDGISEFGFGYQNGHEIQRGKYNVITIYGLDDDEAANFFEYFGIPHVEDLTTAWDTFTQDQPGQSSRYEHEGHTVFDLVDKYRDWGLYKAETRER